MGSFIPGDRPADSEESAADAGSSFADVAAGPALCEMLDAVEFSELAGGDVVEVMAAAYRQHCRQQAVFFRAVVESGLRVPFSAETVERLDEPSEFASEEVRARLAWSRTRAESTFVLAYTLFVELPDLGAAMLAGELDLPRARAFINWTEGLSDEHIDQVISQLLPAAGDVTVGELIDEIKRACLAADPDWAEKKYAAAVRTRRVRGFRNPDGTGNLSGFSQPVDRVIAATTRIDALARQCKRSGDRRGVDLIRSDLFLRMLDGSFEAMSDAEIVGHVLAHPLVEPSDPDPNSDTDDGAATDPEPDDDRDVGPDDPASPDDDRGDGDGGPGRGPGGGLDGDHSGGLDGGPGGGHGGGRVDGPASVLSDQRSRSAQEPARSAWAVPELRVQLLTALGYEDQPGQIPGWDYLPAHLVRRLVDDMHDAQWRWVLCDAGGRAIATGITQRRPTTAMPPITAAGAARGGRDPRRGGIVELAIRVSDLDGLDRRPAVPESWRQVVADIAAQCASAKRDEQRDELGRLPSAGLRRWLQVRDRQCTHPHCRAPASRSDIDHRTRWADDGPTNEVNLGPACRHDHRIKDEGDWTVEQLPDGTTVWRSPLRQRLISQPPPVIPPTIIPVQRRSDAASAYAATYSPPPCVCIMQPCPHADARRRGPTPGSTGSAGPGSEGAEDAGSTLGDLLHRSAKEAEPHDTSDPPAPF